MCFAPMARAQEADTTEAADSLRGQVKLAFRTSDASDILGGVSTIDITELNEKATPQAASIICRVSSPATTDSCGTWAM